MSITFLHTADWQLGKPFAGVEDVAKQALLQAERFEAVKRIGAVARERGARWVLVAGDLFDSPAPTRATVSAACAAIGSIGLPVYAIPGNHDHGGPGGLWEEPFFLREREALAPNLHVLLAPEPVEIDGAILLPCPLLRRHVMGDPTSWVREWAAAAEAAGAAGVGNLPRIVLAHGSVQQFTAPAMTDDDELGAGAANQIDLDRLPAGAIDYVALGDWHGAKQVGPKAWYPGTPELDRFVKGVEHQPGHVLIVEVSRGAAPRVEPVSTARMGWHEIEIHLADDAGVGQLEALLTERIGPRAGMDLLRLCLTGSLGIEAATQLERVLEQWSARLLRLKLDNQTVIAPTPAELDALTQRAGDPLIARVATTLLAMAETGGGRAAGNAGVGAVPDPAVARVALRELHAACQTP